jgi:hypothetical protein
MTHANAEPPKERRHFDPGREPKLLGLLWSVRLGKGSWFVCI